MTIFPSPHPITMTRDGHVVSGTMRAHALMATYGAIPESGITYVEETHRASYEHRNVISLGDANWHGPASQPER